MHANHLHVHQVRAEAVVHKAQTAIVKKLDVGHHHHGHSHAHKSEADTNGTTTVCGLTRRSFWNRGCSCIFSALPDEILGLGVFSFLEPSMLGRLQRVSTRWRFLASDPMLWERVDLSSYAPIVTDDMLLSILSRFGSSIQSLKLCNCNKLTGASLSKLPGYSKKLQDLHLCNLKQVDDSLVTELGLSVNSLEQVSLYGCVKITDSSVRILTAKLAGLSDLSLRNCTNVTSGSLSQIQIRGTSSLKGLNVGGCHRVDTQIVDVIADTCPDLERLNLHAVRVDDKAVDKLTKKCKRINTLHLSSANPFGGSSLLTDASLFSLTRLTDLRILNLLGASLITDSGVIQLASSCRKLERLNLGGCGKLSDVAVTKVVSQLPKLTHLTLSGLDEVTDASITAVASKLARLEELDLHGSATLTDASLEALVANRERLPNFKSLDVGGCFLMTADAVQALQKAWPTLAVTYY